MSAAVRRKGLGTVLLLAGLAAAGVSTGAGRTEASVWPWRNAPVKFDLSTGIPCIYQKDDASPTTVVGLFIPGGRSAVPAGLDGLAAMSTRLLLEIPDEGKVQDLMAQATRLSYICLEDCSVVLVECLTVNLEEALRVAAKIVGDPLITGIRISRAKDLMTANGKIEDDDAVTAARSAVFRSLFGGAGYGSALYGSEASLKTIDKKSILAFVRRFVAKPNVFFCVETDLDREPVRRLLETLFGVFPAGAAAGRSRQEPVLPADRDIMLIKDTKQTYVGRAYPLPRTGLSDMAMGLLLETVLGKGPGSRLWPLRVDRKLAYGVDADLTWMISAGVIIAHLETDRSKAPDAAAALDRALDELSGTGVTEEEMAATRTMARARFLRAVEEKAPRLRTIGLFEVLGVGPDAGAGFMGAIDAVTTDVFNAYIREALAPERALRVTVGPSAAGPAKEDLRARIE
jgi:predicted Zn-dependent peptidase